MRSLVPWKGTMRMWPLGGRCLRRRNSKARRSAWPMMRSCMGGGRTHSTSVWMDLVLPSWWHRQVGQGQQVVLGAVGLSPSYGQTLRSLPLPMVLQRAAQLLAGTMRVVLWDWERTATPWLPSCSPGWMET